MTLNQNTLPRYVFCLWHEFGLVVRVPVNEQKPRTFCRWKKGVSLQPQTLPRPCPHNLDLLICCNHRDHGLLQRQIRTETSLQTTTMMPTNDSEMLLPSSAETLLRNDVHQQKTRTALAPRRDQLLSLKTARDERSTSNIREPRVIKDLLRRSDSPGYFDLPMDDDDEEEDEDSTHDTSFLTLSSSMTTSSSTLVDSTQDI